MLVCLPVITRQPWRPQHNIKQSCTEQTRERDSEHILSIELQTVGRSWSVSCACILINVSCIGLSHYANITILTYLLYNHLPLHYIHQLLKRIQQ